MPSIECCHTIGIQKGEDAAGNLRRPVRPQLHALNAQVSNIIWLSEVARQSTFDSLIRERRRAREYAQKSRDSNLLTLSPARTQIAESSPREDEACGLADAGDMGYDLTLSTRHGISRDMSR